MGYLIIIAFLGIPILSLVWFLISFILFLSAPKGSEIRRKRKGVMVTSAIVAGILIGIIVAIILMFMMAIANM